VRGRLASAKAVLAAIALAALLSAPALAESGRKPTRLTVLLATARRERVTPCWAET